MRDPKAKSGEPSDGRLSVSDHPGPARVVMMVVPVMGVPGVAAAP